MNPTQRAYIAIDLEVVLCLVVGVWREDWIRSPPTSSWPMPRARRRPSALAVTPSLKDTVLVVVARLSKSCSGCGR